MKVLVVDDEPIIALVLREVLMDEGYEVDIAHNARDALRILQSASVPQAILVDLSLPDMTGKTLVENVRGNPAYGSVAVILITAFGLLENVVPDATLYQAVISKPFDIEDVVKQVHRFCHPK